MSFGGSPGDIIIVISLATQLYRKCKTAGGEYLEVAREVASLHTVLRHLKYEIEAPDSLLNRDKSNYGTQLVPIIANCDYTLQQLDDLLLKYSRLADDKPGIWDRIRFGSAEMDLLGDIRQKLNNHKTTITVFLDTVQLHHSASVSKTLDGHGGQLDIILDKVDLIAERMGQRAGSMLTSYGNDDKEVWKEFRRELIAEGFSSEVLQRNKDVLRAYIREIDQKGLLVEAPLTPLPASQSVSPWLESITPGQPPSITVEHSLRAQDMKEVVVDDFNMKFPQSIKKDRGRPDSQDVSRDIQHGISALMIDTKTDGDHGVKPSPLLRVHSATKPSRTNSELNNSSSDESYTSPKGLIIRTSDVTNPNFSTDEKKFLKAPQPHRSASLQRQSQSSDVSRSSSPASINSQASDRSKAGPFPFDEQQTTELLKNLESSRATNRTSEHSRSPGPRSVSLAPDSLGNPIPPDAKWTKIRRSLVSLEVLNQDGHRYEARPDFVAVLGVLHHQEIEELALRTKAIRDARRQLTREAPSQPLPRKPPQNFRYARAKKSRHNVLSSDEDDSISSSEPDRRHPSRHKERRKRSPHGPMDNEQSQVPHLNPSPTNFQPPPAMWSPTSPPSGWNPMPIESYPYYYAPPGTMGALPQTNMQPVYGYPPNMPSFPPNPPIKNQSHESRRHRGSGKHHPQAKNGRKDSGRNGRWRENLTAAGMGGAAVSLLSVLSEAAAEF